MTGISPADAAQALGVSRQRVHALIQRGKLNAWRGRDGRWQIDPASVAERADAEPSARDAFEPLPTGTVDVAAAADKLGVSTSTVLSWISAGRLPAERVGRRWAIRPRDLRRVERPRAGRPPVERETSGN